MKKTILIFAAICLLTSGFAQNSNQPVKFDPMLYDVMTTEEIEIYQKDAPSKLWSMNYDLLHVGYVSSELPANYIMMDNICNHVNEGRTCNIPEMLSSKKFNKYHYRIQTDEHKYVVYPIDNTGFYIVILPTDIFVQQKNEALKKAGF